MSGRRHRPAQRDTSKVDEAGKIWDESTPALASVSTHPTARRPARKSPRTLRAAIGPGGGERDTLVVLRRKLAALIDGDLPAYQLVGLVRQFRDVDAQIRVIDEAARVAAEQAEDADGGDDDPNDETFDPDSL